MADSPSSSSALDSRQRHQTRSESRRQIEKFGLVLDFEVVLQEEIKPTSDAAMTIFLLVRKLERFVFFHQAKAHKREGVDAEVLRSKDNRKRFLLTFEVLSLLAGHCAY